MDIAFATLGVYVVMSLCVDVYLMLGILRPGGTMYLDLRTPSYGQMAEFQLVGLFVMWALAFLRGRLVRLALRR